MNKKLSPRKKSDQNLFIGCISLLVVFLSGCAAIVHPPESVYKIRISSEAAKKSWSQVLNRFVDQEGRVDFTNLSRNSSPLIHYVQFIAQSSPMNNPAMFPSHNEKLAYYLNSYNALAMYGVISKVLPHGFETFWDRARFFKFTVFNIGGENISLYDYENKIIRPLGEPRIHFALNCMVKGCPRLPKTPFRAETLHKSLTSMSKEFVNNSKHVRIIESKQVVQISEIFKFYTKDFVREKDTPTLIAYINRYRWAEIPEDFKIEFIPYDWTISNQ